MAEPAFVVARSHRINPRSQAIVYETRLREIISREKGPSRDRINAVFSILDDINPFLGSYSNLVRELREELYISVFSNSLTSNGEDLERIPYFSSIIRIKQMKKEESDRIKDTISDLNQRIKFRDHDINILQKKNLALKHEIADHLLKQDELLQSIQDLQIKLNLKEVEKSNAIQDFSSKEQKLEKEIASLSTSLAQANHIIDKLTVFRANINKEADKKLTQEEQDALKKAVVIDSQGMIEYDLYQMNKVDEQLLDIMNMQIDDLDASLVQLKKKKEILSNVTANKVEREAAYQVELLELNTAFRQRLDDLLEERALLKRHSDGLKISYHKHKSEKQVKTIKRFADEALRKYAVSVYTSNDGGESFNLFPEMLYCSKCTARTIVCPHRVTLSTPMKIAPGTTHIKFSQPSLRIRTVFNRGAYENLLNAKLLENEEDEENLEDTEDEIHGVSPNFLNIWRNYYDVQKGFKAVAHRAIPLEKLVVLINEIYDKRWIMEEEMYSAGTRLEIPSFIEYFHRFMLDRYQIQVVAHKATHDIFTVLQENEGGNDVSRLSNDQFLDVFISHLSGEMDIMWKYMMVLKKLLFRYETFDIYRYRQLLQIQYPNRLKENYDQLELEFISFSKNHITREIAQDHLVHLIRTGIEPNYRFFLKSLRKFDYQNVGSLKFEDFDEALSQILPSIPREDKRYHYTQSEEFCRKDKVPLERLSQISAYLLFYTAFKNNWVSNNLVSKEFLDMYFKDGIRDEDSEGSDNEDYQDVGTEDRILAVTDEDIESEVAKMRAQ